MKVRAASAVVEQIWLMRQEDEPPAIEDEEGDNKQRNGYCAGRSRAAHVVLEDQKDQLLPHFIVCACAGRGKSGFLQACKGDMDERECRARG